MTIVFPASGLRGVYKSRNRSFKKLTVIDKANGGKADSLNAGLNVIRNDLVVSIDADSIMEPDALLKLVKPFMEAKDKRVIGAGGVIRIANSCEISGGHIDKITPPKEVSAKGPGHGIYPGIPDGQDGLE